MNIDNIKEIINKIENKVILIGNRPYKRNINREILSNVNTEYDHQFETFSELIYLIKHKDNLENLHIFCPVCGKKNKFLNFSLGYRRYCSKKCYHCNSFNEYINIHPEFLNRIKCQNCSKEFKPTKEQIIHWNRMEKHNKCLYITCSKHCTLVLTQLKIDKEMVKRKRRKTLLIKTGNPNYRNLEKAKQTLYKNNGVYHNSQLPNFAENVKNTKLVRYGDPNYNNIQKAKNTFKAKYGVEWNSQTQQWKDSMKNNKEERMKKCYETYKKNGSFKSVSGPELRAFDKLLKKFPDTVHTYRDSKRYPFNCDFYIPSLDLFIECHFGLFHNGKAFDKTNKEHLEELNKLQNLAQEKRKIKIANRYDGIIYNWTILDPKKLATFKNNNLNYKIFYTEKEFNDWFNTL